MDEEGVGDAPTHQALKNDSSDKRECATPDPNNMQGHSTSGQVFTKLLFRCEFFYLFFLETLFRLDFYFQPATPIFLSISKYDLRYQVAFVANPQNFASLNFLRA
jgi:hypothetical protein